MAPVDISGTADRPAAPTVVVGGRGALHVAFLDLGDDRLDDEGEHQGIGGPPYARRWSLVPLRETFALFESSFVACGATGIR